MTLLSTVLLVNQQGFRFYCVMIQFLSEEDVNAIFAVGDLDLDGQIDFRSKDKVIKRIKLILRQK
jgi:hypothetical protein